MASHNTRLLWKYRNRLSGAVFFSQGERPAHDDEYLIRAPDGVANKAALAAKAETKHEPKAAERFGEDHED